MTVYYDTFATPLGEFSAAVNDTGELVATAFGALAALESRLPIARSMRTLRLRLSSEMARSPASGENENSAALTSPSHGTALRVVRERHLIRDVRDQVLAYFSGERRTFALPLAPHGTDFQRRVWTALRDIPYGETRSYGELAAALNLPGGARAVGRANATNPLCLIVPCHRVIGADRSLTGFAFGENIKRWLLAHEGVDLSRPAGSDVSIHADEEHRALVVQSLPKVGLVAAAAM